MKSNVFAWLNNIHEASETTTPTLPTAVVAQPAVQGRDPLFEWTLKRFLQRAALCLSAGFHLKLVAGVELL